MLQDLPEAAIAHIGSRLTTDGDCAALRLACRSCRAACFASERHRVRLRNASSRYELSLRLWAAMAVKPRAVYEVFVQRPDVACAIAELPADDGGRCELSVELPLADLIRLGEADLGALARRPPEAVWAVLDTSPPRMDDCPAGLVELFERAPKAGIVIHDLLFFCSLHTFAEGRRLVRASTNVEVSIDGHLLPDELESIARLPWSGRLKEVMLNAPTRCNVHDAATRAVAELLGRTGAELCVAPVAFHDPGQVFFFRGIALHCRAARLTFATSDGFPDVVNARAEAFRRLCDMDETAESLKGRGLMLSLFLAS